jgi:membrane-associated phospholipid phosphatase
VLKKSLVFLSFSLALLYPTVGTPRLAAQPSEESPTTTVDATSEADSLRILRQNRDVPAWYDMFANIPRDWSRYYSITIRSENIPAILGMAGLTAALIVTDDETYRLSDKWYKGSRSVQHVSDFFEYLGDGRPQFGLAAGFGLYGLVANDSRALRTASQTVQAILACGIVVQTLKHITGRESPLVATTPTGRWQFFPNQIEYHKHVPSYDAYPSGHIATATATLTVILENYPETSAWLKPIGYTVVGLIGVAMANTGIHWYSDYPLGIAMGYSFGMLAAHPEGFDVSATDGGGIRCEVSPMVSSSGTGVALVVSF